MNKISKREIDNFNDFIEKIKEYCQKQEDFYYKIAQNGDHSEDFIYRMTDMASSFHSVCQYLQICADSVFDEMQFEALGDPDEMSGQVEQTAIETPCTKTNTVSN